MAAVVDFDAAICAALDAQQGVYEWGVRDCLTTASAVVEAQLGKPVDYAEWHAIPEADAWREGLRRFRSIRLAHRATRLAAGLAELPRSRWRTVQLRGGDLVVLGGVIRIGAESRDASRGRDSIGYVTPGCEVWHWSPVGLAPVTSALVIHGVFRCPR